MSKGRPPKEPKQQKLMPVSLVREGQEQLMDAFETDPAFSLDPDPTGVLGLTESQKKFITCYGEFHSIPLASQMAGITEEEGRDCYFDPVCKSERQRINRVKNYRRFSRRLLTIDEIGGYLTSLLTDEDIGGGDTLTAKDKLQVTRQIIDINKLKAEAYNNPRIIENVEFTESEMQDLTPEDLKNLIEATKKGKQDTTAEKGKLINELNEDSTFDGVELEYLWSCSIKELQQLLDEKKGREDKKDDT